MITRIRYFSVGVRDLAEGVITYQKRFGLVQASPLGDTRWGFRNANLGSGTGTLIEIVSPNTPNSALARFMDERVHPELNPKGEGPYLVGIEVDDLEETIARVERNGGKVTREPQSPHMAWPHPTSTAMTFFELHAARSDDGAQKIPAPAPTIRSIRSVSLCVQNLEKAAEELATRIGLDQIGGVTEMPMGFKRISLGSNGKSFIALNQPTDEGSAMARLMRQRSNPRNPHGEGIYQIIVGVDNVEQMVEKIQASGGRVTRNPNFQNVAWPHPLDTHMTLMELQNEA